MRTRDARQVRKKAIRRCFMKGHQVGAISVSEAMELYSCLNPNCSPSVTMDIWDNPSIANGPMQHVTCVDNAGWLRNVYNYFIFRLDKLCEDISIQCRARI